jgi:tetratricopeptide (TPR) repeat protein
LREYVDSLKCCKRAKSIEPKNIFMLILVSIIKKEMNYPDEALEILEITKELYPDHSVIHNALGDFYLSQNMIPQSVNSYMDSIQLNSHNLRVYDSILYLYLKSHQYANSISLLKSLLDRYGNSYSPFVLKESIMKHIGFGLEKIDFPSLNSQRIVNSSNINQAFMKWFH